MLPADQHVHTQWSGDAPQGSMRQAGSFGSDAHDPFTVGREFAGAAAMAQAAGFGPDSDRSGLWLRR